MESRNYNKYLLRTYNEARKVNNFKSWGGQLVGFCSTCFFAYAFLMAGYLRWSGYTNFNGEIITGAETITIIFILLLSMFALAGAGQNLPAMNTAKIAGKMAFECIDQVPGI